MRVLNRFADSIDLGWEMSACRSDVDLWGTFPSLRLMYPMYIVDGRCQVCVVEIVWVGWVGIGEGLALGTRNGFLLYIAY